MSACFCCLRRLGRTTLLGGIRLTIPQPVTGPTVSATDLDKYDGQTAKCDQFKHCSNASTNFLRRMSVAGKTPVEADRQLNESGKLVGSHQMQPW